MDLNYSTYGSGPAIVLIHSGGVDSRVWLELVPLLARTRKVVLYDVRGIGRSPAPQVPFDLVDDLLGLLNFLKLDRVALVGHSIGGETAVNFALTYPERVDRLTVIAPSLTGFAYSDTFIGWMSEVNSLAPDIGKMVRFSLDGPIYRTVMASEYKDFLTEMHTLYFTRVFTEWRSFDVIWPQPPAIERLETIAAPTLFVYGTVEWDDMAAIADEFKRVPSIAFAKLDGADHMIPLTHAKELAGHILSFLQDKNTAQ
ncbi:alpha/beta hydrolase [Cohnella xylanilytica]|uniref:Alpha/beta hydrolase n=1 Tax=Cohnella xylanilytica TaxID=557555 RepID=A0A841U3Y0_9BACL|nr:alpha/beta hydrolase [Cohnella xylanilytica]MBB6692791.1 alpha/beta hydrolase [Cohnella xylanilytica]GIO12743.1 alpha/beta hydrolase [Cohnella xylanilytica]